MKKIYELNAQANDVIFQGTPMKCVEVTAFASDGEENKATVTCEFMDKELIFVYDGEVNTQDPGEGPMEEYGSREEALASEYGEVFKIVFELADNMK